jgi:imidazolonepropionase-like amidohydrolase
MKPIITLFLLLTNLLLVAQNEFIIKDVKLFDGRKIVSKTSVYIKAGKIEEVSPELDPKNEVKTIEGNGKTLMPALSNAHVHAWTAVSLRQAAKAGVLNVMDMHGVENFQHSMRMLKDSTNYARYYVAGYAATAPNGHGTQFGFIVPTVKGPEDAQKFIADRAKSNVDYIKIIVEPYRETLSKETVKALINEAHKAKFKAVVHVSRLEDAIQVLENNADALVHIWWDKAITSEKLSELNKTKSFFIVPTLLTTLRAFKAMGEKSKDFLTKSELLAEIKKLHDAGIPILAGTDPPNLNINYGTDLYEELFLFKEAGLSNLEILKTATSNVTKAFDLANMGFIQKGYIADMILINGDPAENIQDIKNIEMIWKAGQIVEILD